MRFECLYGDEVVGGGTGLPGCKWINFFDSGRASVGCGAVYCAAMFGVAR